MTGDDDIDGPDVVRKGPDAFRTISEVADELGLPQHVLRFWETRFPQIKPVKRGGGRRYYRPNDVELLRGVKQLLYGEGYTIRGVQRILREQGGRKLAQAAGRSRPGGEDAAPQVTPPDPGPELWAPGRRAEPSFGSEPDPQTEPVSDSPRRDSAEPIVKTSEAVRETAEPASAPDRLTREQTSRLTGALDELLECRRLIDGRS